MCNIWPLNNNSLRSLANLPWALWGWKINENGQRLLELKEIPFSSTTTVTYRQRFNVPVNLVYKYYRIEINNLLLVLIQSIFGVRLFFKHNMQPCVVVSFMIANHPAQDRPRVTSPRPAATAPPHCRHANVGICPAGSTSSCHRWRLISASEALAVSGRRLLV